MLYPLSYGGVIANLSLPEGVVASCYHASMPGRLRPVRG